MVLRQNLVDKSESPQARDDGTLPQKKKSVISLDRRHVRNTYTLEIHHGMLGGGNFCNDDLDGEVFGAFFECRAHSVPMSIPYLESKTP